MKKSIRGDWQQEGGYTFHPKVLDADNVNPKELYNKGLDPGKFNHYFEIEVRHNGKPVGAVNAFGNRIDDKHGKIYIGSAELSTRHKGKGLGQAMYSKLYEHAANNGYNKIVSSGASESAQRVHGKIASKHGLQLDTGKYTLSYPNPFNKSMADLMTKGHVRAMAKGAQGDWKKEGYTIHYNGHTDPTGGMRFHSLIAKDKYGNKVGSMEVSEDIHENTSVPRGPKVHPDHQRKGIASAMYQKYEKTTGNKLMPDYDQSQEAKALWNQPKRPFGKDELNKGQNNNHPWKIPSSKEIQTDASDWPDFFVTMSNEESLPAFTNQDIENLIRQHGKVVEIPHDQILSQFSNSHPLSRKQVIEGPEGYKPSSDSITNAFKNNQPLPMPIAFEFKSGNRTVLSGRHRLGHAAENQKNLKIISVPYGIHPQTTKTSVKKDENDLVHYSRTKGLKQLDPAKMGSSGVGGLQYKRGVPENKSTFFYTANSKPEDMVTQNASAKYIVRPKPEHKVYDLGVDPEHLIPAMRQQNQGVWNEDMLHGIIKEKGYHGVKWKMHDDTHVVQMYHPMDTHSEESLEKGVASPRKHIGNIKGVAKPSIHKWGLQSDRHGSVTGETIRNEKIPQSLKNDLARKQSKDRLAEQKNIHPNLPKSEFSPKNQKSIYNEQMAEILTKGFVRNAIVAGAVALAPQIADKQTPPKQSMQQTKEDFNSKMLRTIATVESSGGKDIDHDPVMSVGQKQKAYGKYGLLPTTIKETVNLDPSLKGHKNVLKMNNDQVNDYMSKNPGLEDIVARSHVNRLTRHFGNDPAKIGAAWLNGITGTKNAIKQGKDLKNHFHVKKILSAFKD